MPSLSLRIRPLLVALSFLLLGATASAQSTWPQVNLPTSFQAAATGFTEDFEAAGGVVPSYMAVTAVDAATGAPDAEAWANLGQSAACLNPNGGSFALEMGLIPGSTNYHDVQNALVIGLNGGGTAQFYLDFAAHNGGEELDTFDGVWVSDDGINWYQAAADWDAIVTADNDWHPVRAMDLTAAGADLTGNWYLMFAQEDNFPYEAAGTSASDGVGVDDVAVTLAPTPPPPTVWNVPNLPTAFATVPFFEDFDAHAGVPPSYMALNAMDPNFNPGFADAWCDINGAHFTPYSGTACLEMGSNPLTGVTTDVKNAMVLGLDGDGFGDLVLDAFYVDFGEEDDAFDGVWISEDGVNWFAVFANGDWGGHIGGLDVWEQHSAPLDDLGVDTSGRFFLMFAQDDNFPYADIDGIGVDDVGVSGTVTAPQLSVAGLVAGGLATFEVSRMAVGSDVVFVFSTTGSGPVNTPFGPLQCSPPLIQTPAFPVGGDGAFAFDAAIPPSLAGSTLWGQAVELHAGGGGELSSAIQEPVQ